MKKKTFIIMILILSLFACTPTNNNNNNNNPNHGCDIEEECGEKADMSGYESFDENEEYIFVKSNVKEMKNKMDNKDSFVAYFGFNRCPWCRDAMPLLNKAAKEAGLDQIFYINTREKEEWKSNLDIDDYDLFVEIADDYLEFDENNIKHLYVPMFFFIKDGKISTVINAPDYDAKEINIPDDLAEQLYQDFTSALKGIK